jgi:hypothetical protein
VPTFFSHPSFRLATVAPCSRSIHGTGPARQRALPTRSARYIGTTDKLTSPVGYQLSEGELVGEVSALGVKNVETFPFANGPDLNQGRNGLRFTPRRQA